MIIVLRKGTPQQDIDKLTNLITQEGVSVNPVVGADITILGLIGDTSRIDDSRIESHPCVERIMKVAEPFKKANRMFHPGPSEVKIGDTVVGGTKLSVMAGPCSVESEAQIEEVAKGVRRKKVVDDAFIDDLYKKMVNLYRLDQISVGGGEEGVSAAREDLGPLPKTAVALLVGLVVVWLGIIAYVAGDWLRRRRSAKQ